MKPARPARMFALAVLSALALLIPPLAAAATPRKPPSVHTIRVVAPSSFDWRSALIGASIATASLALLIAAGVTLDRARLEPRRGYRRRR